MTQPHPPLRVVWLDILCLVWAAVSVSSRGLTEHQAAGAQSLYYKGECLASVARLEDVVEICMQSWVGLLEKVKK